MYGSVWLYEFTKDFVLLKGHVHEGLQFSVGLYQLNRPRSIYQYSNIDPRLSGQNCKFMKFLFSHISQKRLGYKENNTKFRSLTIKPRSHVRILIYRTWPIV